MIYDVRPHAFAAGGFLGSQHFPPWISSRLALNLTLLARRLVQFSELLFCLEVLFLLSPNSACRNDFAFLSDSFSGLVLL